MRNLLMPVLWIGLAVAATYAISEWAVLEKSGVHGLREVPVVSAVPTPLEPERAALLAQVEKMSETFAEYRAAKDQHVAELNRQIQAMQHLIEARELLTANLERQIQVLTAQRTPSEQVAALRAASLVPNLATLAREAGFTNIEVRP